MSIDNWKDGYVPKSENPQKQYVIGWMDRWVDGRAGLTIAYNNQKLNLGTMVQKIRFVAKTKQIT